MKIRNKQIWVTEGDDYDLTCYDADTPCRKGSRNFLLSEATHEDGDFCIYRRSGWSLQNVGLSQGTYPVKESMALHFNFPQSDLGHPTDEQVEVVRKAVEEALATKKFKKKVKTILANTDVSVVGRSNVYYGDW